MFCDPWTLQVAQEILTGEFIVLELRRIITRMHAEEKLQRPFTENRMMKQMRFFKKDLTLNMCSEKIFVRIMLILRCFSYLFMAETAFTKGMFTTISLLGSIIHKLQAANDDYLEHRVFFFLSNLSMSDRQQQSTSIGTKPQRRGGAAWLPTAFFKEVLQLTFSAVAPLD